jgi:ADP-ribose pyrophosphatase YjhB (NUDIX family)
MASIGVFAVIFDQSHRILCVRLNYSHGGWTTPGGHVETGESPLSALKREVMEETGLDVEIGELIGVYSKPYQDDLVLGFEAHVKDGTTLRPPSRFGEIAEIRFFSKDDLPIEMSTVARARIEDGFARVRGVFREFGKC